MKQFIFLVCLPSGLADHAEIRASCPADAVRELARRFPGCRANIVSISQP